MEPFGQYQLQIFVSLVVILGAALVALICDFLKGNNEQLRELAIELKIRREEELRRTQVLAYAPVAAPAVGSFEPAVNQQDSPAPTQQRSEPSPGATHAPSRAETPAAPPRPSPAPKSARNSPTADVVHVKPAPSPQPPEVVQESTPARDAAASTRKKDWGALLSAHRSGEPVRHWIREHSHPEPAQHGLLEAVVAATASSAKESQPALPAGFHEGRVLGQLLESRPRISGLVVSIGVTSTRGGGNAALEGARNFVQSLLDDQDFACQADTDEFLMVCPKARGASAQRRLSQIAQQLWDYQLRTMRTHSLLFTWGGMEVREEPLDDAIAAATERMQETRRGRKVLTMEPRSSNGSLKAAV
jgi:hypothetical protein